MNKYWMVYRPSKRRELGEDFSSRQPQQPVPEPAAPTEPVPSLFRLFLQAVSSRLHRRADASKPLPNLPKHS